MHIPPKRVSRRLVLRTTVGGATAVAISSIVAACGGGTAPSTTASQAPTAAQTVTSTAAAAQATAQPTNIAAPAAAAQATNTPAPAAAPMGPQRARIAALSPSGPAGSIQNPFVESLRESADKLPPDRALAVDLVWVTPDVRGGPADTAQISSAYATQVASGAIEADLVFADRTTLRALARAKALRDLGPLLQNEAWFKAQDFWGNILQTGQVQSTQLAIPVQASVEVLVYTVAQLQKHGLSGLPTTWTWDQLVTIARALTAAGDWGLRTSPYAPHVFSIAWQMGAEIVAADGAIHVTEPSTIHALEFLDRLIRLEKVSPPVEAKDPSSAVNDLLAPWWNQVVAIDTMTQGNHFNAVAQGNPAMLAMQSARPGFLAWWRDYHAVVIDVTMLPQGNRQAALGESTGLLAIPARAPNPDASLLAIRDLLDASDLAAILPPRKRLSNLRNTYSRLTEKDPSVLAASLALARFLPGDVTSDLLHDVTRNLVLPVVTAQRTPQDAASEAQKLIDMDMAG